MVLPIDNPTKSYWIEAAGSRLRNFRSTDELPKEVDVVIVGSGYTGATTAYWLHKYTEKNGQQPKVLMLEARDICGGATGRNGGQLRPHAYSRYPLWSGRFGPDGALALIKHEMAHLPAFKELLDVEVIAEEVCFKLGETFDAAMSDEAWIRLKGAYEAFKKDHGQDGEVIRDCRLIDDPEAAEEFTQMKGCIGAVVHPSGQIWPYKFVHAMLRIVMESGNLNLQANTPATSVSKRDATGWITVQTPRGEVRTKTVMHATNRWASHLLPSFSNLIFAGRATLAAIRAPEGFIKNTGAQHWDSLVNNYNLQLPPPYNTIMVGGAKQVLVHNPRGYLNNDEEDKQFNGVPKFYMSWPASDIVGWQGGDPAELGKPVDEGGVWTGIMSSSVDAFPFVGAVPDHDCHFIAAGYTGHGKRFVKSKDGLKKDTDNVEGMPRVLLSSAHIAPLILDSLGLEYTAPALVASYPPLPEPFHVTKERVESLQKLDAAALLEASVKLSLESAEKPFCNDARVRGVM
ncbi:FAD dependent oxidoreductase-domain-containing protein [Pseudomassariella vexata]|uniref:FAD dependent oxidoreductase-domain-containing protein n=1 Tax=Pseudomassariella vexata TaxID=1141098 RepID=A0A1Y2E881_9PEZI|nr:FAD dependent oxidoreductase-domain-containing protein [Pseudomassariella vexata]ORY67771.1 FAD dependent oxidoreductase-domain-containing protein [Pseudomassariella vexata]